MSQADRTNGFRIRGLNADADRLAVQSDQQSTWFLNRKLSWLGKPQWQEVGMQANELVVLRAYQASPIIEIEGLGGPYGVLIVENTRGETRTLRNGQRHIIDVGPDGAVVIKTEHWFGSVARRPAIAGYGGI